MELIEILIVIIASLVSGITVYVYDRNKDGNITKEEIKDTISETIKDIIKKK